MLYRRHLTLKDSGLPLSYARFWLDGSVSSNRRCCSPSNRIDPLFSQLIIFMRSAILLPGPNWFTSHPMQWVSSLALVSWHAIAGPKWNGLPFAAIVDFKLECFVSQYPFGISCGFTDTFHGHFLHCLTRFNLHVISFTFLNIALPLSYARFGLFAHSDRDYFKAFWLV